MLGIKNLPGRLKKKKILAVAALLLVLAAAAFVYAGSREKGQKQTDYLTSTVQKGTVEYSIDGTGTLQPKERYELTTKSGGTVTQILVKEGDKVAVGQSILTVANDEVAGGVEQAVLSWEIAQSAYAELLNIPSTDDPDRRAAD